MPAPWEENSAKVNGIERPGIISHGIQDGISHIYNLQVSAEKIILYWSKRESMLGKCDCNDDIYTWKIIQEFPT